MVANPMRAPTQIISPPKFIPELIRTFFCSGFKIPTPNLMFLYQDVKKQGAVIAIRAAKVVDCVTFEFKAFVTFYSVLIDGFSDREKFLARYNYGTHARDTILSFFYDEKPGFE